MPENQIGFVGQESMESAVNRLKAKGAEFATAYNMHMANYEKVKNNPALLAKWKSIKGYADKTKAVIQTINNSVDKSVNWLRDVFGMDSGSLAGLGSVGALPLVPIAYVIAAVTALTYVIGQIHEFNTLVNKGIDPTKQTTPFGDIGNLVKWGVIAFGAWMLFKKFGGKDNG